MYISAETSKDRKTVKVWERVDGKRRLQVYDAPYYFYVMDTNGKYKDIYGNKLARMDFKNNYEFREALTTLRNRGEKTYEADIAPEYKILSNKYYGSDVPSLNITLFDIEVDYDPERGFSSPSNPYAPINAISLLHYWSKESIVLVVPPKTRPNFSVEELPEDLRSLSKIIVCKNEFEILEKFYNMIEDSDIISGWNSSQFDVPYIYERAKILFGEHFANRLSFDQAKPPEYKEGFDKKGLPTKTLEIFGRQSVDYLDIFKKFEVVERRSYSLDSITEEKLPELPKLSYEGSLYTLYRQDFDHFIRYNIRDTEALGGFEDTLGYIQLAVHLCHDSSGLLQNISGTIKLAELTIINFCHKTIKAKVADVPYSDDGNNDKFTGALVLDPQVGMHDWVASVDVNSLYPSAIRSINISPDTVTGQFLEYHNAFTAIKARSNEVLYFREENGGVVAKPAIEWASHIKENQWSLSGYGTTFTMKKQGFIPAILTDWFAQRKAYKARASAAKAKMKNVDKKSTEYAQLQQEHDYAYRLQYIYKIRLNSLYGALGNKFFKFYDIRLAESTTRTGQEVLMHMDRHIAKVIDGAYTYPSPSIIYSDTDSCYFLTHASNKAEAFETVKLIEKSVNKSFPAFMGDAFFCIEDYRNLITAETDVVASKSIFIKKKYYVMQLTHKEGGECDETKLMGVQIKKTSIPKEVSTKLTSFITDLLKGKDWRDISEDIISYKEELIDTKRLHMVGLPKGVDLKDYQDRYNAKEENLALPGHVAASIFYNTCLDAYNDKESIRINSGNKVRTYYLTKKFGRFKSIALPTDMTIIPEWFKENFMPIIDYDAQVIRLIDKPLQNILTAIGKTVPSRMTMMYDDLVDFG